MKWRFEGGRARVGKSSILIVGVINLPTLLCVEPKNVEDPVPGIEDRPAVPVMELRTIVVGVSHWG